MPQLALTVVVDLDREPSDRVAKLVKLFQRSNPDADVSVETIDLRDGADAAVALGVVTYPTVVVELDGVERHRIAGVCSHRALLHALLPLAYGDERALAELRRQLGSPGEDFPRRSRRRIGRISQRRRVEMLGRVELFAELTKRQQNDLASASHEIVLEANTSVVEEGQDGDEFFIVADGAVVVSRDDDHVVARLSNGEHFGEMSLLDDLPRSASVSTDGETTLLAIDRATFRSLLVQAPQIAIKLLDTMSRRLRDAG